MKILQEKNRKNLYYRR